MVNDVGACVGIAHQHIATNAAMSIKQHIGTMMQNATWRVL